MSTCIDVQGKIVSKLVKWKRGLLYCFGFMDSFYSSNMLSFDAILLMFWGACEIPFLENTIFLNTAWSNEPWCFYVYLFLIKSLDTSQYLKMCQWNINTGIVWRENPQSRCCLERRTHRARRRYEPTLKLPCPCSYKELGEDRYLACQLTQSLWQLFAQFVSHAYR